MKTFLFLLLSVLTATAADVKISELPASTAPSTNSWTIISDMDAATKSQKYLITNWVLQATMVSATNTAYASAQAYANGLTNGIIATATNSAKSYADGLTNSVIATATNSAKSYADATFATLANPTFTGTINGDSMELSGDLGADALYLSGLAPGFVYLDGNTNLANVDATAEASFDLLAVNDGSALTSTGATNQNQLVTLSQLQDATAGNLVSYFNTAVAANGFTFTGTVKATNWNSFSVIPALWTNAAVTAANGDYIAAFVTTNTYSRIASGLANVELYAFESEAGSGAIKAEVYIINSVTMAEEYEFEPSPAYQTVPAGTTPTKLTFSVPVTDYTSTTNFYIAVKVKVQESGVDPTIRIVTGGAYSSHLSFNVPSAYFASRTYVDATFQPLDDTLTAASTNTFTGTGTIPLSSQIPTAANPSATQADNNAVNGSAATFMRSDGAPALSTSGVFQFSRLGLGVAASSDTPLTIERDAQATTPTAALCITNTTAAAAGAQQMSPSLVIQGNGWKTDATAGSEPVAFRVYTAPIQGAAHPSGRLIFESSVNNATWANAMYLAAGGALYAYSSIQSAGGVIAGSYIRAGSEIEIAGDTASYPALARSTEYVNILDAAGGNTGGLMINSTTPILGVLSATATLNFGETAAQTDTDLTITVAGAADGDVVSIGVPAGSATSGGCFTGWVSAADTVTVRFSNYSSSAKDPASGTFRAQVTKF